MIYRRRTGFSDLIPYVAPVFSVPKLLFIDTPGGTRSGNNRLGISRKKKKEEKKQSLRPTGNWKSVYTRIHIYIYILCMHRGERKSLVVL